MVAAVRLLNVSTVDPRSECVDAAKVAIDQMRLARIKPATQR